MIRTRVDRCVASYVVEQTLGLGSCSVRKGSWFHIARANGPFHRGADAERCSNRHLCIASEPFMSGLPNRQLF